MKLVYILNKYRFNIKFETFFKYLKLKLLKNESFLKYIY